MSPEVTKILNTGGTGAHRDWLAAASDDLLDEYIANISNNDSFHRMAVAERERRHFLRVLKPHWSVTPNFWITVIACLAAVGAFWFGWRADVRDSRLDQRDHPSGQTVAQPLPPLPSSPSNSPALKP
jgi:hypothetical protein